jgi:hypothetical protein
VVLVEVKLVDAELVDVGSAPKVSIFFLSEKLTHLKIDFSRLGLRGGIWTLCERKRKRKK